MSKLTAIEQFSDFVYAALIWSVISLILNKQSKIMFTELD